MRIRLCDTEQDVSGISVELVITAEPFAESVPYSLTLHAGGSPVAHVAEAELTPADGAPLMLAGIAVRDVDLRVRRHGDEVSLEVLRTRGRIQVSIVLAH